MAPPQRDMPPGTVTRMEATPPVPAGRLDRAGFDALLRARVTALVDAAEAQPTQEKRRAARADAQEAERRARRFADAVDAGGATHIGYDNAVVIVGSRSTQVCDLRSYDDTPYYWQAVAGDGEVIAGVDLLADLGGPDATP